MQSKVGLVGEDPLLKAIEGIQLDPTPGKGLVRSHCILPIARSVLEHLEGSILASLHGWDDVCSEVKTAKEWNSGLRGKMCSFLPSLEAKISSRNPQPVNADYYILGVLHLLDGTGVRSACLATSNFAMAGKIVSFGVGLIARLEALVSEGKNDEVVSVVIELEGGSLIGGSSGSNTSSPSSNTSSPGFRLKSITARRKSVAPQEDGLRELLAQDARKVSNLILLYRALAYDALYRNSGQEIYKFKASQDFATLFQSLGKSDENMALVKACKGMTTEGAEAACILFTQAASLNPQVCTFPYLCARRRAAKDPNLITEANAALVIDPTFLDAKVYRAIGMMEQHREKDALVDLDTLLRHPTLVDNPWLLCLRARARWLCKEYGEALADFQRALNMLKEYQGGKPKEVLRARSRINIALAQVLIERGDNHSEAENFLNVGIACDVLKVNPFAYKLRSDVRVELGLAREASDDFLECAKFLIEDWKLRADEEDVSVKQVKDDACKISDSCEECAALLHSVDRADELLTFANLCLESFGETSPRLQSVWLYWLACALSRQENQRAEALSTAQRALQTFAWDDSSKEKANLLRLVAECGGEGAPASLSGPVPQLGLATLKKTSQRRGSSDTGGSSEEVPKVTTTKTVTRKKAVKKSGGLPRASLDKGNASSESSSTPELPRPVVPPAFTDRELGLMAEIEQLRVQLEEANGEIRRLKALTELLEDQFQ